MTSETPLCKHFGSCGGCSAQHIQYSLTLENKKKYIADQLRRLNITPPENMEIKHVSPYHYRNRMDFVFFNGGLGLREKDRFDKENELQILIEKLRKELFAAIGLLVNGIKQIDRQKEFSNAGHILRLAVRVLKSSERKYHYLEELMLKNIREGKDAEKLNDRDLM